MNRGRRGRGRARSRPRRPPARRARRRGRRRRARTGGPRRAADAAGRRRRGPGRPRSTNAIEAPTRPRSSNSRNPPYQVSASSTSPTSRATWFRRGTGPRPRTGGLPRRLRAGVVGLRDARLRQRRRTPHAREREPLARGTRVGDRAVRSDARERFQFSSLKDACLRSCRHPASFIHRHYERGTAAAFKLGARHRAFCAGCCWALMLVMFALGVASLIWMALLTALMVHEKTRPAGARTVPLTGVTLLALGSTLFLWGAALSP
jgi:hypothetical protein